MNPRPKRAAEKRNKKGACGGRNAEEKTQGEGNMREIISPRTGETGSSGVHKKTVLPM